MIATVVADSFPSRGQDGLYNIFLIRLWRDGEHILRALPSQPFRHGVAMVALRLKDKTLDNTGAWSMTATGGPSGLAGLAKTWRLVLGKLLLNPGVP